MTITAIRPRGAGTDWVTILLIPVMAIRVFSTTGAVVLLLILTAITFARKTEQNYSAQFGPLILLCISTVIVLSRAESKPAVLFFALTLLLIIRLVMTVEATTIIASLIDGAGIYLLLNVAGFIAGLQSPNSGDRIGAYVESGGFVRITFPLSSSLEVAPTIASIYLAAVAFLIIGTERRWRIFRTVCIVSAIVVAWHGADRTGLFAAVILPTIVFVFPLATRWLAQAATIFTSISALVLPTLVSKLEFALTPLLSYIAPNRDTHISNVTSLSNRTFIWSDSIAFWKNYIHGAIAQLFGFGQAGQYKSGASMVYADALSGTVRHPERASMHNSFLQQLFDGGLLGWLLLTLAIYWTSVRLSRNVRVWRGPGVAAVVAMVALLINSMTQVSVSPGYANESFWALLVLVGVSCQLIDKPARTGLADR